MQAIAHACIHVCMRSALRHLLRATHTHTQTHLQNLCVCLLRLPNPSVPHAICGWLLVRGGACEGWLSCALACGRAGHAVGPCRLHHKLAGGLLRGKRRCQGVP